MKHWRIVVEDLIASHRRLRASGPRGPRHVELSCDPLEERVTPSHLGPMQHLAAAVHVQPLTHHSSGAKSTLPVLLPGGWLGNSPPPVTVPLPHRGHGHSTNSALQTALKTLQSEVQTIELASGTTVGQLTAIKVAFRTLASDGLHPTSQSALSSFENSLVTTNATTPGSITSTGANTTLAHPVRGPLHEFDHHAHGAANDGSDHGLQCPGCRGDLRGSHEHRHHDHQYRLGGCPGRFAHQEHRGRDPDPNFPLLHTRDRSGCRRLYRAHGFLIGPANSRMSGGALEPAPPGAGSPGTNLCGCSRRHRQRRIA